MWCAAPRDGADLAVPSVTAVPQHNSRTGTAWQSSLPKFQICSELKQGPPVPWCRACVFPPPSTPSCGDSPARKPGAAVLTRARLQCLHWLQSPDQVGDTCFNIHFSRSK